jgi:hypothetical protein
VRRSRLALAVLAVLLTACEPAAAGSPAKSPGSEIRGYVMSRAPKGSGLVINTIDSTDPVLIYDKVAWQRCAKGDQFPACRKKAR